MRSVALMSDLANVYLTWLCPSELILHCVSTMTTELMHLNLKIGVDIDLIYTFNVI